MLFLGEAVVTSNAITILLILHFCNIMLINRRGGPEKIVRCPARESLHFFDEMCLVRIIVLVSDVGPGFMRVLCFVFDGSKKSGDPCIQFWRHADFVSEPPFEVAEAHIHIARS